MPYEDLTGTIVRKICMACSREFSATEGCCPHDGNMLVPLPSDPYVGKRLADRYQIQTILGTGGMGVVYLAWHELMERKVAIKMLRAQLINDSMSVRRFQQEAKAASRLSHPNIITTYDFGVTNTGQPFMVVEYLQGVSLAHLIKEGNGMEPDRVVRIFTQACEALDHAHKQGVIHRDLKPGNIMIITTEDTPDYVKVVDFGVAKLIPINAIGEEEQGLTQAGEVCGSPVYMSPEQCMGMGLDRRADIYSMGVVLYEALTGRLPLVGKNMVETMQKHLNDAPPPFKVVRPNNFIPERLEQVVMRALSKKPEQRQQSMAQLAAELEAALPRPDSSGLRTAIVDIPEPPPAAPEEQGNPWTIPLLVGGLVAVLGAGIGMAFLSTQKPAPKPTPAIVAPVNATTGATSTTSSASTAGGAATISTSPTGSGSATTHATGSTGTSNATSGEEPDEAPVKPVKKRVVRAQPVVEEYVPPPKPKPRDVNKRFDDLKNLRNY